MMKAYRPSRYLRRLSSLAGRERAVVNQKLGDVASAEPVDVLRSGAVVVVPRADGDFIHADRCAVARALAFRLPVDHQANRLLFGVGRNDERVQPGKG